MADFTQKSLAIVEKTNTHYNSNANQYDKETVSKVKDELDEAIFGSLYLCFDA